MYCKKGGSALDEASCLSAVLSGQADEYREMVTRYQGMVFAVCLKMVQDHHEAEELAQDVFVKAFQALPTYRGEAKFSTWLYKIAITQCLNWRRSRQNALCRQQMLPTEFVSETETPEEHVILNETSQGLHRLVAELKEPYRTVVRQYYFEHRSYQDIAKQTGLSVKTVESQLYRARRMLRVKGGGLQ